MYIFIAIVVSYCDNDDENVDWEVVVVEREQVLFHLFEIAAYWLLGKLKWSESELNTRRGKKKRKGCAMHINWEVALQTDWKHNSSPLHFSATRSSVLLTEGEMNDVYNRFERWSWENKRTHHSKLENGTCFLFLCVLFEKRVCVCSEYAGPMQSRTQLVHSALLLHI